MQFGNPIVGLEELIREAIRSKNFVTGVSGWRIARDGTAEFSAIIIRGSGTADAVVIGPSGLPQVIIRTTPTNGLIVWPTNRPIEQLAASATSAAIDIGLATERAEFQLTGPTVSGANDGVRMVMRSQANNGSSVAEFSVQNKDGSDIFFVVDETEVRVVNRRIDSRQLAANGVVLAGYVTTDAFDRIQILGSGEIQWGPGNAARDTNLYRGAAGVLQTDDTFVVLGELHPRNLVRAERPNATDSQYETRATSDGFARWFMRADGLMWWGPGNVNVDTNLYRSAANTLRTDDSLDVGTNLTVGGTTTLNGNTHVNGILTTDNRVSGTVVITPVANTPTSTTVTGLTVPGTAFRAQCTANTTVIGTTVLGVAFSSPSSTSIIIWVTRTNTTNTSVSWEMWGT